jgi:ABC-type transporter Mla subunit MlaD
MNQSRTEIRVGIVVLLALLLLAMGMLQFGKGNALFRKTYTIILRTRNVGGIRKKSAVLMSGVTVGVVSAITLERDGTNAAIHLKIYDEFKIREDAHFLIEQSSFFSDQFVAIHPEGSTANLFTNLSEAHVDEPFNLLKAARSGSDLIKSGDETAEKLDAAISKVRAKFLNEKTLTNFSAQIAAGGRDAEGLRLNLEQFNSRVQTNDLPAAIDRLDAKLHKWDSNVVSTQGALQSNGARLSARLELWQAKSAALSNQMNDIQQGKGTAGAIFENQAAADQISNVTARLANTSSNINHEGLWHVLFQPRMNTNGHKF